MSELYADDYDSLSAAASRRLVPDGLRRLAGAALFLALIGGLGLWAYRLGTRDAAEVPIIRAMEGPARLQPEDPGGLRAAHQGLEVNAVLAGRPAPTPEADAPVVAAPNALADEDAPQGELVVASPLVVPEDTLAAGEDLRMPLPDDGPSTAEAAPTPDATPAIAVAAAVAAAVAEQAGAPAGEANAEAPAVAEAEAAQGTRPLRRPVGLTRIAAAAPAATVTPAAAAAAPAAREVASVKSGSRLVQLGAFDSEGIARQAWNILATRHADLLGSKSLYVERTTANARVFYRLRVAGFDGADQTRQMCEALRARGVDCIPVTLQ